MREFGERMTRQRPLRQHNAQKHPENRGASRENVVTLCQGDPVAGEELRATLRGNEAQLGLVRARDVARLITGLESAMAAAAYAALGKPRRAVAGRHRAAIESSSRLAFRAVASGSVVAVLALPSASDPVDGVLDVGVDDLAGAAFDRLVASFGLPDDQVDQGIARTLAELGEALGIGERHDELLLESSRTSPTARLDQSARARMRRLADAVPAQQADVLVGSLREADFDRRTARLRTSSGESVVVAFPPELSDAVQQALRSQAQLEGLVTYDPSTALARRVELRQISSPNALPFDTDEFWTSASIQELADAQGVASAALDRAAFSASADELRDLAGALADLDA